jgi:ABC-2 type transport system permease protein
MNFWPFIISAFAIVLMPIVLASVLRRWQPVPWFYFIVGVLTFTGAQIVHILLNELLIRIGVLPSEMPEGSALIGSALLLGLTAGLTEELGRAVGFRLVPKARRYADGLMMGLGHGGLEAMLVGVIMAAGISSLWNLDSIGLLPQGATAVDYATVQQQLELINQTPLAALAPLVERLIAITAQVSLTIMVLSAFTKRQWLFVLVAIFYHALLDAAAILGTQWFDSPWSVEALLVVLLMPVAVWAWRQRSRDPDLSKVQKPGLGSDLAVLMTACRKELLFQWRTKRALIIVAIFLVFGMASPLVAKFTPEIIGSLDETEQFADLIPDPSVGDAIGQYLSNLTQFGFILVILLGMNAVAGEKEKGTAAMILSKPLPRWSFIASKYISQGLVYLIAVALAGIAAYYYTFYLFERLPASTFFLANLLLFCWLMVYAAVTMLGSSLGKTTAAAAGIAAIGGIVLLISGTIPRYGALAPSGLVNWASALSLNLEGAANGGSLLAAITVILLLLVASVAAIEEQEI